MFYNTISFSGLFIVFSCAMHAINLQKQSK